MADAATTVATIEVQAAAAPATVTLARPVKLTGKLLPPSLSAGLKLLAIEADGPTPGEALAATVDAAGQFSLSVAPGRTYRLQIEPAQERKLPRLFLGPHAVGMADSSYGEVTLSEGVPIVGVLTNGTVRGARRRGPDSAPGRPPTAWTRRPPSWRPPARWPRPAPAPTAASRCTCPTRPAGTCDSYDAFVTSALFSVIAAALGGGRTARVGPA